MSDDTTRPDKALIRAAGEHAVVSELSRRGALAALVDEGARGVDVLARKGGRSVSIQVKTKRPGVREWPLRKKLPEEADFFVLVNLSDPPEFYVVPTATLAAWVEEDFREWVGTPGRGGRPRDPDNPFRGYGGMPGSMERLQPYRGAWDQLWEG